MASRRTTIYTCDRCGKELDVDDRYPDNWKTVLVDKIDDYCWNESNAKELCEDCAKQFITWFDNFMGYEYCSNCTKSERLPSGGYACLAELYDPVNKTCFVPKKEATE